MSDRTCSIDDCTKPVNARGWCKSHYYRWNRYGDPLASAPPDAFARPARPRPPCNVEGCERPHYAHGICEAHYARQRRHGGLHDERAASTPLAIRLTARLIEGPRPEVRPELGPCLLWTGALNGSGYATINDGTGRIIGAHVAAVLVAGDKVPDGMEVDHLCFVRHCARRSHLEVVTHDENQRRRRAAA